MESNKFRVFAFWLVVLAATSAFANKIPTGTANSNYGQQLLSTSLPPLVVGDNTILINQVTNSTNLPDAIIYTYTLPFSASNFTFTTPQSFTNVGAVGVLLPSDPNSCPTGCNTSIASTVLGFTLNCTDLSSCDVSGFNASYVRNSNGTITFTVGSTTANDNLTLFVQTSTVPEPGTITLLGTGLLGLFGVARRKLRA